jgi:hypothetical protein
LRCCTRHRQGYRRASRASQKFAATQHHVHSPIPSVEMLADTRASVQRHHPGRKLRVATTGIFD